MGFGSRLKKFFKSGKEEKNVNEEVIEEPIEINNGNSIDENNNVSVVIDKPPEITDDKPTQHKTFNYLDELIHSGDSEIVLDSDIVLDDDEKSQYMEGIKLDVDGLIIDGNGFTIDACQNAQIFQCTADNVTIKNVTLKRGHSEENGGAIKNFGSLLISDSTFHENSAGTWGGAIYNTREIEIIRSVFTDNRVNSDAGAIFNHYEAKLNISDSSFMGNAANYNAGAISNNMGTVVISNSSFKDNYAERYGALHNSYGIMNISDSSFEDNFADEGSSIFNEDEGEVIVSASIFCKNACGRISGTIFNDAGNFKIYHCTFSKNRWGNVILNNDAMQIHNSIFKDNDLLNHIVSNEGDDANLGIFDGEFVQNPVTKSVINNCGKFCSINGSVFEDNMSCADALNIINRADMTLNDPKIKDSANSILNEDYILLKNSDDLEGRILNQGVIEIYDDAIPSGESFDFGYLDRIIHESPQKEIVLKDDISLENYERDFYEGGIELDIDGLTIDGRGKSIDGSDRSRIFIVTGNNITLKNITFKNGRSHMNYDNDLNNHGGALKINHCADLTIKNCKFLTNISQRSGGAISNCGKTTVVNSSFSENLAESGGAINNWFGDLAIFETSFSKNDATDWGGGAINCREGKITISNSTFTDNNASGDSTSFGGVLHLDESTVSISKSSLNANTGDRGGAIYNLCGKLEITESVLESNIANEYGGAIENEGDLMITNSSFNKNTAKEIGGAIHNWNNEMSIEESSFSENSADIGGAIRHSGKMTLTKCIFSKNTSEDCGGAINADSESEINLDNCTFKDNKPDDVYK